MDTGKDTTGQVMYKANSTVSRYACRIICERQPPYTARLYAGAFDTSNRIKPSVSITNLYCLISIFTSLIFDSRLFHLGRSQMETMIASLPMVLAYYGPAVVLPQG